jgi:hypothetical protein
MIAPSKAPFFPPEKALDIAVVFAEHKKDHADVGPEKVALRGGKSP